MLYLCATPIGNLEDVTLRVLRVLREADCVWAEDTRRTLQLLNHFDIKKTLVSYHEHNAKEREAQFLSLMRDGKVIAYCSDAGMPGISDPGAGLVSLCVEHGLPVTVLPGASAVLSAVVLSGLGCESFTFIGFLPREKKLKKTAIETLKSEAVPSVIYESPVRVPQTLDELREALGGSRKAALIRELTKIHEEAVRGTLEELCAKYREAPPKGECVIVVEGTQTEAPEIGVEEIDTALEKLIKSGFSVSDAAAAVSAILGVKKNEAYKRAIIIPKN